MDATLIAWSAAVKARHRPLWPTLWLFTDAARLPDPLAAAARLPRGRAGVVLRDDSAPGRAALAQALARICRERRLVLVVAGDPRLARAVGAGLHLRAGRRPGPVRPRQPWTSSAHSLRDLRRAHRAGASLAFLSPAFPTASHPGATALTPLRWAAIARQSPLPTLALGGITGRLARRVSPAGQGAGAIGALAATDPCVQTATVFRHCHADPQHAVATRRPPRP